jgi:NADH-quinone oxidoreductase subunit C
VVESDGSPMEGGTEHDAAPSAGGDADATRHGVPVSWSRGQQVLHPSREAYPGVVQALFDEGFLVAVDLTGVDYLTHQGRVLPDGVTPERFEVVVNLLSHTLRERVRLRVQVPASDPVVPSITGIHPGCDSSERETWDMFGIGFDGHPDLTRILLPEDWIGFPLRKDQDSGRIPVQFKGPAPAR